MFLVEEKMGAAAVDEEDEVALVFWRLGVGALFVPVVVSVSLLLVDIFWKRGFGRGFGIQDPLFDAKLKLKEGMDVMNIYRRSMVEESIAL